MKVVLLEEGGELADGALYFGDFTTVRPLGEMPARAIALVSFGEGLAAIGILERETKVATQKRRIALKQLEPIDPALSIEELAAAVPTNLRRHVHLGQLAARTGEEALGALERLRPGLEDTIARLREYDEAPVLQGRGYDIAAMEKDAVGLALSFLGLDRRPIRTWSRPDGPAAGFLRGLPQATLREEQILDHDLGVFAGWDVIDRAAFNAVHFREGQAEVTVVNVNETPVERALGVDLIYYHAQYEAFVLVQYKRLADEGGDLGHIYRPDGNLERELDRMRQIVGQPPDPVDALSYRLGPGTCFLKLCESVVLDPYSQSLISGLYLPLEYFEAAADIARGPQGGRAYGYSTLPRHLTNTLFIDLVKDAWVGTAGDLTDEMRQIVEELVATGHSVVLAEGRGQRVRRPRG